MVEYIKVNGTNRSEMMRKKTQTQKKVLLLTKAVFGATLVLWMVLLPHRRKEILQNFSKGSLKKRFKKYCSPIVESNIWVETKQKTLKDELLKT